MARLQPRITGLAQGKKEAPNNRGWKYESENVSWRKRKPAFAMGFFLFCNEYMVIES